MKCYMAPMEGITGYLYRNAHASVYGPMDKYFTPFIVPTSEGTMKNRDLRDILPDNNRGLNVVPQIMTNKAEDLISLAERLQEMGYAEVNLNLGCPSGTVTAKGRGAGFLAFPEELDRFLETVMNRCPIRLSVKTRLGVQHHEEFERLLEIYNTYPISEVILHPRVQKEMYRGRADREMFRWAAEHSKNPLVYNGDLFTAEEIREFMQDDPKVDGIMLGRGLIANPGLWKLACGGTSAVQELIQLHDRIYREQKTIQSGDRDLLFRMKELWYYMKDSFPEGEREFKKLRKIQRASEYEAWFRSLVREVEWDPTVGFQPPR